MALEWYVFDCSYLIGIDYRQLECRLTIDIDARMSIDHPTAHQATKFEDYFIPILLTLEGMQYYKVITNQRVMADPNKDIGNIDHLGIISLDREYESVKKHNNGFEWSIILTDGNVARICSPSKEIHFLDFQSEYIAFQAGFEKLVIQEGH